MKKPILVTISILIVYFLFSCPLGAFAETKITKNEKSFHSKEIWDTISSVTTIITIEPNGKYAASGIVLEKTQKVNIKILLEVYEQTKKGDWKRIAGPWEKNGNGTIWVTGSGTVKKGIYKTKVIIRINDQDYAVYSTAKEYK